MEQERINKIFAEIASRDYDEDIHSAEQQYLRGDIELQAYINLLIEAGHQYAHTNNFRKAAPFYEKALRIAESDGKDDFELWSGSITDILPCLIVAYCHENQYSQSLALFNVYIGYLNDIYDRRMPDDEFANYVADSLVNSIDELSGRISQESVESLAALEELIVKAKRFINFSDSDKTTNSYTVLYQKVHQAIRLQNGHINPMENVESIHIDNETYPLELNPEIIGQKIISELIEKEYKLTGIWSPLEIGQIVNKYAHYGYIHIDGHGHYFEREWLHILQSCQQIIYAKNNKELKEYFKSEYKEEPVVMIISGCDDPEQLDSIHEDTEKFYSLGDTLSSIVPIIGYSCNPAKSFAISIFFFYNTSQQSQKLKEWLQLVHEVVVKVQNISTDF